MELVGVEFWCERCLFRGRFGFWLRFFFYIFLLFLDLVLGFMYSEVGWKLFFYFLFYCFV